MRSFPLLDPDRTQHIELLLLVVDADAGAAYRSLERSLGAVVHAPADSGLQRLVDATLHAYARALARSQSGPDVEVWTTFVRCAASLHDALAHFAEREADPRRRCAAKTLEQIVRENADLIAAT
jgi:hypothetical protein